MTCIRIVTLLHRNRFSLHKERVMWTLISSVKKRFHAICEKYLYLCICRTTSLKHQSYIVEFSLAVSLRNTYVFCEGTNCPDLWVLSGFYSFLPQPKSMNLSLSGNSKMSLGVNESANGLFVSMWPRDELATHPECYPAFASWQLRKAPADPCDTELRDKQLKKMNEWNVCVISRNQVWACRVKVYSIINNNRESPWSCPWCWLCQQTLHGRDCCSAFL